MSTRTNITPSDYVSDTARAQLTVKTALANLRTSIPVEVVTVTNSGGVSPVGHVNVKPLVNLVDSNGVAWENPIIYNVPYMRIQGGSNAVIIDPQVGDIGIATVCDRDISTVKNTGKISSPGSNRKFNMSDMVYLMTIIGQAPAQYIQFNASGITILSPSKVTINAPSVEIDASTECKINAPIITLNGAINQTSGSATTFSGSMTVTGNVTAAGTSLHTHKHGGITPGGGQTGTPV